MYNRSLFPNAAFGWGVLLGAQLGAFGCTGGTAPVSAPAETRVSVVPSNLLRDDYAGSKACSACHAAISAAWQASPMHRMTRPASRANVVAPFAGESFIFKDDTLKFVQRAGTLFMELQPKVGSTQLFRVDKVIGGRQREDFAGVSVGSFEAARFVTGNERILPASYLLFDKSWRYKGYSVLSKERPELRAGLVWRRSCIFCHNTTPQLSRLFDELYGPGAPGYQGATHLDLPEAKGFRFRLHDAARLQHELARESAFLGYQAAPSTEPTGDELQDALIRTIDATRKNFGEQHLVELGIGCESCHGGAKAHAQAPLRYRPSFLPHSDFVELETNQGRTPTSAEQVNWTCGQCHSVLFTQYPFTWEGRDRNYEPGGSSMNSGEARDFLLGGCTSQLSCTACHDPHGNEPRANIQALAGPKGDALCARCHETLAGSSSAPAGQVEAHSHHARASAGSRCVNCHMPKKNLGLDYQLTRYHRIGSPNDKVRVEGDRPLECALCHEDKSVLELVTALERWWPKRYDRRQLQALYGTDLRVNALVATLARGKPHERATALGVVAQGDFRGPRRALAAFWVEPVLAQVDHEYPLVRFWAKRALETLFVAPAPFDPHAAAPTLREQARTWAEQQKTP